MATKKKTVELKGKENLTERVMLSVTPAEREKLEEHAAKMSEDLGVPVSLSAAARALCFTNLRAAQKGA